MSSMTPHAPMVWPKKGFQPTTYGRHVAPKTCLIASASVASFSRVAVPWEMANAISEASASASCSARRIASAWWALTGAVREPETCARGISLDSLECRPECASQLRTFGRGARNALREVLVSHLCLPATSGLRLRRRAGPDAGVLRPSAQAAHAGSRGSRARAVSLVSALVAEEL